MVAAMVVMKVELKVVSKALRMVDLSAVSMVDQRALMLEVLMAGH